MILADRIWHAAFEKIIKLFKAARYQIDAWSLQNCNLAQVNAADLELFPTFQPCFVASITSGRTVMLQVFDCFNLTDCTRYSFHDSLRSYISSQQTNSSSLCWWRRYWAYVELVQVRRYAECAQDNDNIQNEDSHNLVSILERTEERS